MDLNKWPHKTHKSLNTQQSLKNKVNMYYGTS